MKKILILFASMLFALPVRSQIINDGATTAFLFPAIKTATAS